MPVRFCAFVFPFDIMKTWEFWGNYNEFLEAGCASHWHIDCDTPRQEAIRREPVRKIQKEIAMAFTMLWGGTSSRPSVIGLTLENSMARVHV